MPPLCRRFWGFANVKNCASLLAVSDFFRPNLKRSGRIARGVIGTLCLVAGIVVAGDVSLWGLILVAAGLFAIYEALSGWCVARACGLKTKI